MSRESCRETLVFVGLLVGAVAARWFFRDLPNFAPVAALALFSGYYFRSSVVAMALPLSVMLLSDLLLGGYDWIVMLAVYGMLTAPVALRRRLRISMHHDRRAHGLARLIGLVGGCTLVGSLAFFAVTNLAAWWAMDIYPLTAQGLIECYWQALPFFRFTLAGDLAFAAVLFGTHAWMLSAKPAPAVAEPA